MGQAEIAGFQRWRMGRVAHYYFGRGDIVRSEFGKVRECLDVYHAWEHLSGIGKLFYGEESAAYKKWYELAKGDLLSGRFGLIDKRLALLERDVRTDRQCESLRRLRGYFSDHSERLWEGRAIGSGQVEGVCKSMIGRRLKQTGARWQVRRFNRMTTICSTKYGSLWKNYWKNTK